MQKKLSDYLHLYIGQKVETGMGEFKLIGIVSATAYMAETDHLFNVSLCQPILRPLSDMSHYEIIEFFKIGGVNWTKYDRAEIQDGKFLQIEGYDGPDYMSTYHPGISFLPQQTLYLLSKGIDIFGLIEAGLAIDKTKL